MTMKIIDAVWCEYKGKTIPIDEANKLIAKSKANAKPSKKRKADRV